MTKTTKDLHHELRQEYKKLAEVKIKADAVIDKMVDMDIRLKKYMTEKKQYDLDKLDIVKIKNKMSTLEKNNNNRQSQVQQIRKEYSEILQNPTHKEHKLVKSYLMGLSYAEN